MSKTRNVSITLDFDGLRPESPFLTESHSIWRTQVRDFVDHEIEPNIDEWDAAGTFPDEIYEKAAQAGILGISFPESLNGRSDGIDLYHRIIFAEEFHRFGTGVVFADLATHWIGLPPIIKYGSDELLEKVARPVLAGTKKIAFAVTEPTGGSDVSRIATKATRCKNGWLVNGSKTLISGAMRADFALVAVRTGGEGMGGISLLLIETDRPGVIRRPVAGLSWYNSSIGTIDLKDVEVQEHQLIGRENKGFAGLTEQFNIERFSSVAATLAMCRVCLAEAIAFARQRETFGKRLIDHQVIRHKLVDMVRMIRGAYAYLDQCVWRFEQKETDVADLCMLKIQATTTLERCARDSLHILGGTAYSGGSRAERIYRESRIFSIGGGTEEILCDLSARQLGF